MASQVRGGPGWSRIQLIVVFLLGCGIYAGSLGHQWALDDDLVYTENPAVQRGIRGIPELLTSDAYAHLYERMGREAELAGGRYRPLSLVSFAIEQELFGGAPVVAHAGNVLLYALTLVLLLLLLRRWRPGFPAWGFAAALIFAVHPLHAEVVANVKSRDEILSLLFLLAALFFVTVAADRRRLPATSRNKPGIRPLSAGVGPAMAAGGLCAFLALLSKEYAISLLVLAPLALSSFRDLSLRSILRLVWPIGLAVVAYLLLRIAVVGVPTAQSVDLLNDPYLLATTSQEWATKVFVLLRYLLLLVWPYPLSSDYSYRQIAYRDFGDPLVGTSIAIGLVLMTVAWLGIRRRHWLGFASAFYLTHLFLVSNLVIDIGATMGERLAYHASVGFALALAGVLTAGTAGTAGIRWLGRAVLVILVGVGGFLTIQRVPDWKNDLVLFLHDVEVVPESARVNANAGRSFLVLADGAADSVQRRADLERAVHYLEKSLSIDPDIVMAYFALGTVYDRLGDFEQMERSWNQARTRFADHPFFATYDGVLADRLTRLAATAALAGQHTRAGDLLERAVRYAPDQASLWAYLGSERSAAGDVTGAIEAWGEALLLDPARSSLADSISAAQK